jgi:hypothetical protein
MSNYETDTLRHIIADCVQSQYRYLPDRGAVDPHDFGYRIARAVIQRLETANIGLVSRWAAGGDRVAEPGSRD